MYSEKQSVGQSQLVDAKPTEFQQIAKRLEEESSTLFNLSNELLSKADSVMKFPGKESNPEGEMKEPNDFVSKIWYEIAAIQKQNNKLKYLLDHLNKII